jgi:uncharacterized protein (TIGR02452 family)
MEICKNGQYRLSSRSIISIKALIEDSILNTEVFNNIDILPIINQEPYYNVKDNIIKLGTIDSVLKLRQDGIEGEIIALNFASANNPGGGFLKGSNAQEESICRASALYLNLVKSTEFYEFHRNQKNPLYSNKMIYSPDVPIIRNDKGQLIKCEKCSFITSPAVNAKVARERNISNDTINKAMKERINKIISVAVKKNPEVLLFGAFGCGVFGNDREVVFKIFEEAINNIIEKDSIKIIFAVI